MLEKEEEEEGLERRQGYSCHAYFIFSLTLQKTVPSINKQANLGRWQQVPGISPGREMDEAEMAPSALQWKCQTGLAGAPSHPC